MNQAEAAKKVADKAAAKGADQATPADNTKPSGIDVVWKNALDKYEADNHITRKELLLAADFGAADTGVQKATVIFETWRHPKDQKDKVITAVGGCLDWVDTAVGFIADHVDGTYATPAKIIAGAVSKMIKAAKDMTADFDLISKTFGDIYQAIKDIGLLQDRVKVEAGVEDHFINRLTDIFVALFEFCSFGTRMFEASRKRRYFRALIKGRDEKIQEKCDNVTSVILLFRATVPLKILREVEDIRKDLKDLGRDFPDTFIKALRDMRLRPSDLQLLTTKNSSLEKVKTKFGVNAAGMSQIETHMQLIENQYVAGTFDWVKDNSEYKTWFKAQKTPFLCVSGPSGTGKTYFTYHVCSTIQETMKARRLNPDTAKTQQNISVAYFFFDPGRPETQSLQDALSNIIVQVASQDAKFCDSIVKEIDKGGRLDPGKKDIAKILWRDFLSGKLERTAESSRLVYILLDGVDQLSDEDDLDLLHLFQDLNCDKTAIQVMMTGSPENLQKMNLNPCEINLPDHTRTQGDIRKIIESRLNNLENLKTFSQGGRKEILDHLDSRSEGVISFVDLTLGVMEQSGDEANALKEMKNTYNPKLLYTSMIEIVLSKRSFTETRSVETLFAWITYAKDRLSVYEVRQLLEMDSSLGEFDVQAEIQGKSKSMLYTSKRVPPDEEAENSFQQISDENEFDLEPSSGKEAPVAATTESKLIQSKLEMIEFRQPALKEHLESTVNKLIGDPLKAKVQIFTRLCDILCDRTSPETESRKVLYKYATLYFVDHFLDIDPKETTPQQGRDLVEALSRVLTNENNVCATFEEVMREKNKYFFEFDLYDQYQIPKRILAWAKKMSYHEDELLVRSAEEWVEATIKAPTKIFDALSRGHLESLSKKITVDEAWLPYKMAYHALAKSETFEINYDIFWRRIIDTEAARLLLEHSKDWLNKNPISLVQSRIALALLLNDPLPIASDGFKNRTMALELYKLNLVPDVATPGPEEFYSYVGIAEYYSSPITDEETKEAAITRWKSVLQNADLALHQRQDEKGALGSELDNSRCTTAFWLKAESQRKLGLDREALETCKQALAHNELEFTPDLLRFLGMIINILSKENHDFEIIEEVQETTFKMKIEWLLSSADHQMLSEEKSLLRKAAVLTRRVDVLIQLYEEAIDYWRHKDWYGAQILGCELAVIYRRDARATKMAEITLDNIMKEVRGNISRPIASDVLRFMFPEAVDILFENYTLTRSKARKEVELDKLRRLINDLEPTGILEGIDLSKASLTLAKMFQGLSKTQQARDAADKAFKLCINDLQDFIALNDLNAFRVLSKILMFAGLDLDAGIALSLQYSDVDKKREDIDNMDRSRESSLAGVLDPAVTNEDIIGKQDAGDEVLMEKGPEIDKVTVTSDHVATDEATINGITNGEPSGDGGKLSPQPQETTVDMNSSGAENALTDLINGETKSTKPQDQKLTEDGTPKSTADADLKGTKADEPKEWPEDLIPDSFQSITCNGQCSSPPLDRKSGIQSYYCLDCHDVDFCPGCHDKQVRYYTEMGEGFWFKCCWAQHQYLQQPVKNWHGVKDGMIRIGAKQKPYTLWLQAVKEKWSRKMDLMV